VVFGMVEQLAVRTGPAGADLVAALAGSGCALISPLAIGASLLDAFVHRALHDGGASS
jgi:hypothetical protein